MIHTYNDIISVQNLLEAWNEFKCGKKHRKDVQEFEYNLMGNILSLHNELVNNTYTHGSYEAFKINDPKPRDIHKATVKDRLVHHALYRIIYYDVDKRFIFDSYSCRKYKGTHRAMNRFRFFAGKVSKNNTKQCFILKCDIKKFFASIDHSILMEIVGKYRKDKDTLWLIENVIRSFKDPNTNKGVPLGNLTSQLLVNIYMNEFDQFIKHDLKAKYYIRYADDFVILHTNKKYLKDVLLKIRHFLIRKCRLELHPKKVSIETLSSGIDFLGWVHFSDHRVLRSVTKRRAFKNIKAKQDKEEAVQSYLGLISHGNTNKLQKQVEDLAQKYSGLDRRVKT